MKCKRGNMLFFAEDVSEMPEKEETKFATLFRNSRFVQLGDMKNKHLVGRIFYIVGDELYIEFGGKFMCVCPRPTQWSE